MRALHISAFMQCQYLLDKRWLLYRCQTKLPEVPSNRNWVRNMEKTEQTSFAEKVNASLCLSPTFSLQLCLQLTVCVVTHSCLMNKAQSLSLSL